jgi:hypothetical protein
VKTSIVASGFIGFLSQRFGLDHRRPTRSGENMTTFLAGIGILCGGCGLFIAVVAWGTHQEMKEERAALARRLGE